MANTLTLTQEQQQQQQLQRRQQQPRLTSRVVSNFKSVQISKIARNRRKNWENKIAEQLPCDSNRTM